MNENQSPCGSKTPETDALIRTQLARVGITPTALAAKLTLKCEELERDRDKWRGKADHLGIACKVWEDEVNRLKNACDRWSEFETLHPLMHCQTCGQLRSMDYACDSLHNVKGHSPTGGHPNSTQYRTMKPKLENTEEPAAVVGCHAPACSASPDSLSLLEWRQWAFEICSDFKIEYDPHDAGLRSAITKRLAD